jgi:hypothetical protein
MFKEFSNLVAQQFTKMCNSDILFQSQVSGQKLWDTYINSFKPEHNKVFRDPDSTEHNCNLDKNFIRRYGNVVVLTKEYEIITMWDVELKEDSPYFAPAKAMSDLLKSSKIANVFLETFNELNSLPYEKINKTQQVYRLGIEWNHKIYTQEEANKFGVVKAGKVYRFEHFYVDLPKKFVDFSGKSIESIQAEFRSDKDVFYRGLSEISLDTMLLVKDLANQGSLLNVDSYLPKLEKFIKFKQKFNKLVNIHENYCWVASHKLPYAKFRNELIGTLCVELTEGAELNKACLDWNKRADPINYMKASAPITQKQIKEAEKFVKENGYVESFNRRFATIKDINVDEILHKNNPTSSVKNASIFDGVQASKSTQHKRSQFNNIEEIPIDKFMKDILPTCTSIEAFVENRMESNLVTLMTAEENCKLSFKWSNPFSWTYNGNLTGKSQIRENVKNAGGKIEGVMRCSLQWNDENTKGIVDLDLHCNYNADKIYFGNRSHPFISAYLDVDMIRPSNVGIENIIFTNKSHVRDGKYEFVVHNYDSGSNTGFKIEIEIEGQVYNYHYKKNLRGNVKIATVTVKKGVFEIEHHQDFSESSRKIWNIDTNEFHKVNLVCLSPNFWGDNEVGNKHYFFMLDNCKSDVSLRSFHNEYLNSELLNHRKVMEVLANTTMIEPASKQLCGIGFNATVRDEVILKLSGNFKRTIKVKF